MARVSTAHADDRGGTVTTAQARTRVREARERAAIRLAGTPWRVNADVDGGWLRQGPLAPEPIARRSIDAALQRGALTLRGYDRVLRVAWTVADLDDAARLEPQHIGRALFLKRGIRP